MNMRARIVAVVLVSTALSGFHQVQAESTIRIGVLNDLSGPYADLSGKGSVIAAQMAAEDFAKEAGDRAPKVEILSGDHQNKPDIGALIARSWIDRDGVAAIVDVPNSAVALAINQIMREKDRAFLASSTATSDLTGSQCAPTTVQWTFDTWALANGTARAVVQQGGLRWFFIGANYALGAALVRDATAVIKANGGTVLGDVRAPLGAPDLSSYLLQAQSSGADVIGTANGGDDLINTVKQASEFGVARDGKQRFAGLLVFLTDVKGIGLEAAQGLLLTEAFYWDLNDNTRAWSRRFADRNGGRMPTMNHAGVYSETLAFLHAAVSIGGLSGKAIVAQMKTAPIDDPLFGRTEIRADGRAVHPMYLFRVKAPANSKGPYDLYDLVSTIPAEQAFRPIDQGGCPMIVPPGGSTK
ncbi:ABC transporter substrate-binding protein [Bradyrhizobium sp. 1]|uniref:ABC transporter substrate-binding protein n=1 Tax=Bradyrhizobium sp. 1 TaxID=241591 RepID=UPI001FFBB8E9|nr:ABC transporter substrate-binding protein [Bradyrhizobium sp. 1]MCK1394480.1 ABC transporter substrate-binding protein [Bradyrhizobium sp. 1]